MKKTILQILLLTSCSFLTGQVTTENLPGQVSFVSSRNVYVKFKSTSGLAAGDTLYFQSDGRLIPALVINNLSSLSCVSTPLTEKVFAVADPVIAIVKREEPAISGILPAVTVPAPSAEKVTGDSVKLQPDQKASKQLIKGSISINSYSDLSNTISDNSQKFRYTLSLDARNIGNSKFSVESYISFKHKAGEWDEVKNDIFNALKIYSLAVRYDLNQTTHISLGRRINPRLSSVGAVDGLHIEKGLGGFSFGAVAGFRPDFEDYGFNSKLFQYALYAAYSSQPSKAMSESSIAIMQQMNDFRTDRRFLYFQHSNNFIKNLNFFSTFEFDLYKLTIDTINNTEKSLSTFDLTGLYVSLRYKILNNFTVYGSYDARKNIIYYETYKTFIDRILETELRQGFRLQANYRISNNLLYAIQAGYRFLKTDPHPSRNIHTYLTYNHIPIADLTATISATYLESSHMIGKVAGLSLTRDFFNGKVQTGIGYRFVDYRLPETQSDIVENIGEFNFSWQFTRKLSFSMYYEGTFERDETYNRFYVQLRKRF